MLKKLTRDYSEDQIRYYTVRLEITRSNWRLLRRLEITRSNWRLQRQIKRYHIRLKIKKIRFNDRI